MVIVLLAARVFADGLPLEFAHSEHILGLGKGGEALELFNHLNVSGDMPKYNLTN